jgi:hypothetical protein
MAEPLCIIHCAIHCFHPPPVVKDVGCLPCRANPAYYVAKAAVNRAKDAGLVTRDTWEGLASLMVYSAAESSAIGAVVAAACSACLTADVFGS